MKTSGTLKFRFGLCKILQQIYQVTTLFIIYVTTLIENEKLLEGKHLTLREKQIILKNNLSPSISLIPCQRLTKFLYC